MLLGFCFITRSCHSLANTNVNTNVNSPSQQSPELIILGMGKVGMAQLFSRLRLPNRFFPWS
jgi:hypothetical protein